MASLNSIAEQAYSIVFPQSDDETALPKELFEEASRTEYAWQVQLMYWKSKRDDGEYDLPSHLLREVELDVKDNKVDLCNLNVFRSFSSDIWLQQVGEIGECKYIRHTVNLSNLLVDEEDRGNQYKTYIPIGDKLKFPDGVYKSPITIIYASKGEDLEGDTIVDDVIGNIVLDRLVEKFSGKSNLVDVTNNTNPHV